jgi:hypothetical protein
MLKNLKTTTDRGMAALVAATALFASLSVLARFLNDGLTIPQQVYMRIFVALLLALAVFRRSLRWNRLKALPLR